MKTIKQSIHEKIHKLKIHTADVILTLLFFTSIGLGVWGINIYRLTIINAKYLFAVVGIGAIIALPIILFGLGPTYKKIWIFLISISIGGGLFYFSFLYLNSTYSDKEQLTEDFNIIKAGTLGNGRFTHCRSPYAVIDFNGMEKELIFYCEYEKTINTFSKVRLEYSKGLFGFDIIKTKTLLK